MRFVVLGPVTATVDGQEIRIARAQRRAILGFLLLHANRTVTVPELIDALWGGEPPATARTQIFAGVSAVRQALRAAGREPLTGTGGGYRLDAGPDELDLLAFDRHLDEAREHPGRAVPALRAALGLWGGRPLGGISGAFVEPAQAALEERRLTALEQLFERELEQGNQDRIVAELTELAAAHPFRERLAGALMLAQYRGGRPADALATYRRIHRLLADELGIDPGRALTALHQRILDDDATLLLRPAPRTTPERRFLPRDIPDFTGRGPELARLDTLAGDDPGTAGLVVVSAVGGIGKTALAVHWAHCAAARFPDGQLYLDLRGYDDRPPLRPIEALSAVLGALEVPVPRVPADVEEASAVLRAALADQRVLLLLDNARTAEQVRPLLPASAGALVLVTSRDALGGLVARDGARRLELGLLPAAEATELLTRLLGPGRVGAGTADLVALCGGLPLALRIAAAHLALRPALTVAGYVAEVAAGARLASLTIDDDPRSSVRAVLDQSFRGLTPARQRAFALLGLVPGPDFTAPAAAALLDLPPAATAATLRALTDASLVLEHRPGRFTMHDLTREYARSQEPADRAGALGRLVSWTVEHAESAAALLFPGGAKLPSAVLFADPDEARAWLTAELASLVAVIGSGQALGHPEAAWRIAFACRAHLVVRIDRATMYTLGQAALDAAIHTGEVRARAAAELVMAKAYTTNGYDERCLPHARRSLELARQAGWRELEVEAHNALSVHHLLTGDLRRSVEHARGAFDLSLALGVEPTQYLGKLGLISLLLGDLRAAGDYFGQTLESRNHQAGFSRGITLLNLAEVRTLQGRPDEAEPLLDEAIKHLTDAGNAHVTALAKADKAVAELHRGRPQPAWELLAEARTALDGTTDTLARSQLALRAAEMLHVSGRAGEAAAALREVLDDALAYGNRHPATQLLVALARVRLAADPAEAAAVATRAAEQAREGQFRLVEGQALTVLAAARSRLGRLSEAADTAAAALRIHRETGHEPGQREAARLLDM